MTHLSDKEIQSYLDNTAGENQSIYEQHLRFCEKCRLVLKTYQDIYADLNTEFPVELSPKFVKVIMTRVGVNKSSYAVPAQWIISIILLIAGLGISFYLLHLNPFQFTFSSFELIRHFEHGNLKILLFTGFILAIIALIDRYVFQTRLYKM